MLRQIAYRSCTNLAFAATHGDFLPGLHRQSICTLGTLVSLAGTSYPQQCWLSSLAAASHPLEANGGRRQGAHKQNMQDVRQLSRHLFTHSKTDGPTEQDKAQYPIHRPDHVFVYQGPLSQTVSRLKKLSLFSCACAFSASPIIMYMSSASTLGAKASIAVTLCGFGAFTTGLMHWFTSPYVHRLTYNAKTGLTEVETLTLFAKYQRRTFSQSEVQYPTSLKPQTTFQVHGQVYYLDADNFEDKDLLAKLSPKQQETPVQQ